MQKVDADLDDIAGYIAVALATPKTASDFVNKLQGTIEEARSFLSSLLASGLKNINCTNIQPTKCVVYGV